MSDYDLSQLEVLIADPQPGTARLLRDILVRMRVKRVTLVSAPGALREVLTRGQMDLVLMDAENGSSETFQIVRWVRNDPGQVNPFVCLVVTTWNPTTGILSKVANSGADDLLVKPAAPRQVQDRITGLIENRKRFVVTADYTGPDRRKSPRSGTQIPLIDVPNSLRLKAIGQYDKINIRDLSDQALEALRQQKVVRNAFQIPFLVEFALPGLGQRPVERMAVEHLARIPAVLDDLTQRLVAGKTDGKIETACKRLAVLADRALKSPDSIQAAELAQLRKIAHGLLRAAAAERAAEELVQEVTDAVNGYRSRLHQMIAAKVAAARAAADLRQGAQGTDAARVKEQPTDGGDAGR